MSLNIQFYLLIHTVLYGVFLGLTFDTFGMVIRRVKRKLLNDFLIIFYWITQLPLAIWYFHQVNHGNFQSYLLIFVLVGGLVYYKFLRRKYQSDLKVVVKNGKIIVRAVKKIINVTFFTPIRFIFGIIFDIIVLPKHIFMRIWSMRLLIKKKKERNQSVTTTANPETKIDKKS